MAWFSLIIEILLFTLRVFGFRERKSKKRIKIAIWEIVNFGMLIILTILIMFTKDLSNAQLNILVLHVPFIVLLMASFIHLPCDVEFRFIDYLTKKY